MRRLVTSHLGIIDARRSRVDALCGAANAQVYTFLARGVTCRACAEALRALGTQDPLGACPPPDADRAS